MVNVLALLAALAILIYAVHDGLQWFDLVWLGVALYMLHAAFPIAVRRA